MIRKIRPHLPFDLFKTFGPLRGGPTVRFDPRGVWRATRNASGPATVHMLWDGEELIVEAWGPGAEDELESAGDVVGAERDASAFVPTHPLVRELHRRFLGLRILRTGAVFEAMVPTVIAQKVIEQEAQAAYGRLVNKVGEPAPGPGGLKLPPSPEALLSMPYFEFHPLGIEKHRADLVRLLASRAQWLDETASMPLEDAYARLRSLPGVGPWTAAKVGLSAFGDEDAVPVGDYHLKNTVSWALAREPRGDDDRMLELLEPFRPYRGRVTRLLTLGHLVAPRYGPRLAYRRLERSD